MKKSMHVHLTILGSVAAAAMSACGSNDRYARHCVDANDHAVADSLCRGVPAERSSTGMIVPAILAYHWYYGGSFYRGNGFSGYRGGSFSPPSGVFFSPGATVGRASSSGSTSRGGFGTTGSSHGGAATSAGG